MMHWYVLRSKPNKENVLREQLDIRNYDAYCPSIKVKPVNPRSRKVLPYFPGYLFVRVDLEKINIFNLRWLPGSQGLVDFGGELAYVPDDLLQAIRQRFDRMPGASEVMNSNFRTGDIVTINNGPFAGYQAIFDTRLPGKERVRVLLKMLQDRQMPLELSSDQIGSTKLH
jgi:transcriptional antiterminator RfaH